MEFSVEGEFSCVDFVLGVSTALFVVVLVHGSDLP